MQKELPALLLKSQNWNMAVWQCSKKAVKAGCDV